MWVILNVTARTGLPCNARAPMSTAMPALKSHSVGRGDRGLLSAHRLETSKKDGNAQSHCRRKFSGDGFGSSVKGRKLSIVKCPERDKPTDRGTRR